MASLSDNSLPVVTTEVAAGSKVVLNCDSNDYQHNFLLWILNENTVIGPGSQNYDNKKYKYEVLSGKLYIDHVTPAESGVYKCLSRKLDDSEVKVGNVEMIVHGSAFTAADGVKIAAIVISLLVIIVCAVIYFRLRREWNKYDGRAIVAVDDTEEEDGEEIYNQTTTSISQPMPGPSRNPSSEHLIYGIDNQGLDTDFNSVFENIQIKTPHPSLI